jgi:YD repeat-containing protein
MKPFVAAIGTVSILLVAYLCLWPVPINPVVWKPPVDVGYVGPFTANHKLANLKMISLGEEEGPEHIVLAKDGMLYTTVLSGNILRMRPDGTAQEVFVNTGGRVLGFDFDAQGNLIAADSIKGLLSISRDKKITVLTDTVAGNPKDRILYADGVIVAKNGKIFVTDASTRFSPALWGGTFESSVLDIIEQSSTGRVLEYDPATHITRTVASGLSFANGIALSQDERHVFVNETGKFRVWKIAVAANALDVSASNPMAQIIFDNLPGYPDNLMRGLNGKIWLGFAKPRNPAADNLGDKVFLRKVTLRLPRALWPIPPAYGHVMAFTEDGKVVEDLQDPSGKYPETTAVTETADKLYVQSLHAKGLGWLPK